MPKTVTSPISRFPGSVVLKDPIPLSACVEWEEALADCHPKPCLRAREIRAKTWQKDAPPKEEVIAEYMAHFEACKDCKGALSDTAAQERMLKSVRTCVEKWDVPAFDLQNPPGSPKVVRSKFVAWIIGEINTIYNEAEPDGDPNAFGGEPTPTPAEKPPALPDVTLP
jgi:hypothetical protein